MPICPFCRDWEFHPRDTFCGGCGRSFILVSASVGNALQFGGGPPVPLTMELRNDGRIPVGGGEVSVVTEDGRELWRGDLPLDALKDPGDTWTARWDPQPSQGPLVAELCLRPSRVRQAIILARLGLCLPRPAFGLAETRISTDPAVILAPDAKVELRLVLVQGRLGRVMDVVVQGKGLPDTPVRIVGADGVPAVLRTGEPATLLLPVAQELRERLLAEPSGLDLMLRLRLSDQDPVRLPFRLALSSPAQVTLEVPRSWRMQVGRPGLVLVDVSNRGGTEARLTSLTLLPLAVQQGVPASAAPLAAGVIPREGMVIGPGQTRTMSMRLPAFPDAPTDIQGTLIAQLADSPGQVKMPVSIAVTPPRPFDGAVAVDFGTTETAVSIRRRGASAVPEVLRLDAEGPFVPTILAYAPAADGKLETLIGREVTAQVAGGHEGVQVVEGLKWRLAEEMPLVRPDGSRRFLLEVVGDYLRALRSRIEEHVEIGAELTDVLVTIPSRFEARQTEALQEAFRLAGLRPRTVKVGDIPSLVSESWSPASLALPLAPLAPLATRSLRGERLLPEDAKGGVFGLITFDMGGGSTDVSAFRVRVQDLATIDIQEVFTDGSTTVAGNVISRLLANALRPSLREAMISRGVSETQMPIHPPWEPMPPGGPDPLAGENGRAFAKVVWILQSSPSFARRLDFDTLDAPETQAQIDELGMQVLSGHALPDLVLRDRDGRTHRFPWGDGDLRIDMRTFVRAFVEGPTLAARRLVRDAMAALDRAGERRGTRILLTGRGTLFPLVSNALDIEQEKLGGTVEARLRMADDMLKPITSLGALVLADLLPRARGVRFTSGLAAWFGFQGALDPATGDFQFVALSPGFPTQPVSAPLPPDWGGNLRILLGTAHAQTGPVGQVGFRADLDCDIDLGDDAPVDGLHLRVEPGPGSRLRVGVVAAADAAAASGNWLGVADVSLLPSGYHRTDGATVEALP